MISAKEINEQKYKKLVEENNKLMALNKKLASENLLLKRKNEEKNSFLASMSHEIRNPLYAILGFSELILSSESLDKELCENMGYIFRCSEMLIELLNDLLDLSKVEAGKMDIFIAKTDVAEIVNNIHSINKGHLVNKGLYFKSDLGGISEIETDAKRLNQILFNLVSNAIKFTEEGGIEIGLLEKEKSYYFYVKDTGIGLTPKECTQIFETYKSVYKGDIRQISGSGLGLSICRKLVDLLGGEIWVESKLGRGSTFFFYLPKDFKSNKLAKMA